MMASDKQRKAASAGRLLISQQLIKNLHEVSTKTQVSGMRSVHVDTSAPLL